MLKPLSVRQYYAPEPGKILAVFGAVHGNEVCGTIAIQEIVEMIEHGELKILKGGVIFVPVANPQAFQEAKRHVDENLNRVFRPTSVPQSYEAKIANLLCPILDRVDALLDLHSVHTKGSPFVFLDACTPADTNFAACLGVKAALKGWKELYTKQGHHLPSSSKSMGATGYARSKGKLAAALECGFHNDPAAVVVAKRAIVNALSHLEIISAKSHLLALNDLFVIYMTNLYCKEGGGEFLQEWNHQDFVIKDTPIARQGSGQVIVAPADGFIIIPRHECPPGEEWFYFGVKENELGSVV